MGHDIPDNDLTEPLPTHTATSQSTRQRASRSKRLRALLFLASPETPLPNRNGDIPGDYLARYAFARSFIERRSVLDVGCGLGYGAHLMAESGARRVLATDASRRTIRAAQILYHADNLRFAVARGVPDWIPPSHIDIVTAFEILEHLPTPRTFLEDIGRILRDDGVLILSTPNALLPADGRFHSPFHCHEYDAEELVDLLHPYFPTVKLYGVRRKAGLPPPSPACSRLRRFLSELIWAVFGKRPLQPVARLILRGLPRYILGMKMPWVVIPTEPWSDFELTSSDPASCPNLVVVCHKRGSP